MILYKSACRQNDSVQKTVIVVFFGLFAGDITCRYKGEKRIGQLCGKSLGIAFKKCLCNGFGVVFEICSAFFVILGHYV